MKDYIIWVLFMAFLISCNESNSSYNSRLVPTFKTLEFEEKIGEELDSDFSIYDLENREYLISDLMGDNGLTKLIVLDQQVCSTCFETYYSELFDRNPAFFGEFKVLVSINHAKSIYMSCIRINSEVEVFYYEGSDVEIVRQSALVILDQGGRINGINPILP